MIKKFDFQPLAGKVITQEISSNILPNEETIFEEKFYTQNELEAKLEEFRIEAEKIGYNRGFQDKAREIDLELQAKNDKVISVIEQIYNKFDEYNFEEIKEQIREDYLSKLLHIISIIHKKICAEEIENSKLIMISDFINEIMLKLNRPTNFTISLNPNIIRQVEEKMTNLMKEEHLQHTLKFEKDPDISEESCYIKFLNTRISFDRDFLKEELDKLIESYVKTNNNEEKI